MIQLLLIAALLLFFGLYLYAERDIRKLEDKYKICFDERAAAQSERDALRADMGQFAILAMDLAHPAKGVRARTLKESPHLILDSLKESFKELKEEHRRLLASARNLCLATYLHDEGMVMDGNLDALATKWKETRELLYKYEQLAVTEAPKLGVTVADANTAWEMMQWITQEAHRVKGKLRVALHDYDVKLEQLLETESINDVLRKQSECYRISRDQARGDIEGIKRQAISFGIGYDQYNAIFSVIGSEIPSGPPIEHPGKPADIVPSPKRRPRKFANGQ